MRGGELSIIIEVTSFRSSDVPECGGRWVVEVACQAVAISVGLIGPVRPYSGDKRYLTKHLAVGSSNVFSYISRRDY